MMNLLCSLLYNIFIYLAGAESRPKGTINVCPPPGRIRFCNQGRKDKRGGPEGRPGGGAERERG